MILQYSFTEHDKLQFKAENAICIFSWILFTPHNPQIIITWCHRMLVPPLTHDPVQSLELVQGLPQGPVQGPHKSTVVTRMFWDFWEAS